MAIDYRSFHRAAPAFRQAVPPLRLSVPTFRDTAPMLRDGYPVFRLAHPIHRDGFPMHSDGAPMLRDTAPVLRDGVAASSDAVTEHRESVRELPEQNPEPIFFFRELPETFRETPITQPPRRKCRVLALGAAICRLATGGQRSAVGIWWAERSVSLMSENPIPLFCHRGHRGHGATDSQCSASRFTGLVTWLECKRVIEEFLLQSSIQHTVLSFSQNAPFRVLGACYD